MVLFLPEKYEDIRDVYLLTLFLPKYIDFKKQLFT